MFGNLSLHYYKFLYRDVLKSDSAMITIPELELVRVSSIAIVKRMSLTR